MTNDFVVEILPAGGKNLRVRLSASYPPLKREALALPRQLIELESNDIETLRGGNAPEGLVTKVSEQLSQWLLSGDLNAFLKVALMPGHEPVRLVLEVDEDLLPALADLPVELLYFDAYPFAISNRVNAIVHLLPQASTAQPSLAALHSPLRVLIVRSSPKDLKVYVPAAEPLREHIKGLVNDPKLVRVDVLSSETAGAAPVTWEAFRKLLEHTSYDILVYLGHGDLLDKEAEDRPAIGILKFEHADGVHHEPVRSDQLRVYLNNHPVPVVLLTGCLTAAEMDAISDVQLKNKIVAMFPRWMRGIQGVAQALVGGESGVQVAVGMRYKLETTDAVTFLEAFFESLLTIDPNNPGAKPGDVEAAVRAGRAKLFAERPLPPSWSAPVIFRTLGVEPTFGFLSKYKPTPDGPNGFPVGDTSVALDPVEAEKDARDQERREKIWKALVKQPDLQFAYEILDETEKAMRERALARDAPLLMPGRVEVKPNNPAVASVYLYGALGVSAFKIKLLVGSNSVSFESLDATQALTDSGYELSDGSQLGRNEISFSIKRTTAAPDSLLPEGELVRVGLKLGQAIAVVYPLTLEMLEIEPNNIKAQVGSNAVLVPATLA
jgi:hypothetical protein